MLVDLHHGKIGLESEVGKGSNFFFTLPVYPSIPPMISEDLMSILAIDPDIQVLQRYEQYLQETKYKIIPLTDPSMALIYAREMKPHAITLDILWPGHDGWKIFDKIKYDSITKDIPIIICSILDETEKGRKLGVDGYLTKPILAGDFVNAISSLPEKSKQSRSELSQLE